MTVILSSELDRFLATGPKAMGSDKLSPLPVGFCPGKGAAHGSIPRTKEKIHYGKLGNGSLDWIAEGRQRQHLDRDRSFEGCTVLF